MMMYIQNTSMTKNIAPVVSSRNLKAAFFIKMQLQFGPRIARFLTVKYLLGCVDIPDMVKDDIVIYRMQNHFNFSKFQCHFSSLKKYLSNDCQVWTHASRSGVFFSQPKRVSLTKTALLSIQTI